MTAVIERTPGTREVFRKHHPGLLQSDEQVIRQFVVRQPELEILLDVLRGNLDSPSCQHALILGSRGRGKSTLLARVAVEIRTNAQFTPSFLPVWFTDESAEIFDAVSFWLDTLFHLANEVEARDPEVAAELRETRTDLVRRWQGAALEERARAAVLEAAERLDRRLVLMVENLHTLFGSGNEDFGWKLRATLQSEPRIILLATATTRFTALDDARAPFFELFHTVSLDPLNTEDCRRLWERIAGESLEGRDIRPIEILTGGSPRLLVIVGQFAGHLSTHSLMERLAALIDDHSEYFRSQLEALPPLERRVFLALADLWQPSTAGEVAFRARMDVRTVSVMLGRLKKRGALMARRDGKKQLHAVAERLFCIYYKLRREQSGAGVIHNLIRYMALFYRPAERDQRLSGLIDEALTAEEVREGLARAMADHPVLEETLAAEDNPLRRDLLSRAAAIRDVRTKELMKDLGLARSYSELAQRLSVAKESGHLPRSESEEMRLASTLIRFSLDQGARNNEDGRVGALRLISDYLGDSDSPHVLRQVGAAAVGVASTVYGAGDYRQAIETCEEVVRRFDGFDDWSLKVPVAQSWNLIGDVHRELGNSEAAYEAYETVVAKFATSDKQSLRQEVDRALASMGGLKEASDDSEVALSLFERVVARDPSPDTLLGVMILGSALVGKALIQWDQGMPDASLDTIDKAIEYFGRKEATSPRIRTMLALSMVQKGRLLSRKQAFEAAAAIYGGVVTEFGDSHVPGLVVQVATAMANLGLTHAERGDIESAVNHWDEVIRRFGLNQTPWVQDQVAQALLWKVHEAMLAGRTAEVLVLCDEVAARVVRVSAEAEPRLTWTTLCYRVRALIQSARIPEAVSAFGSLHDMFLSEDAGMLRDMQRLVPNLVAGGGSADDLAEVLSSDAVKADSLRPLVVALRLHAGQAVRSPVEVLEVAKDVGALMKDHAVGAAE